MEAAGTVLEVLSVSFGTLQRAVAGRPRERAANASGSCREGFGGQFRNLQKDPARGREPGASSECQWRVLEVLSGTFETPPKLRL